jgi:cytoskeletal protein CcmA (bactofilin family)
MFRRTPPGQGKNGHKGANGNGDNGHTNGNGHSAGNGNGHAIGATMLRDAFAPPAPAPVRPSAGIETVLGSNCAFSGTLTATAGVRIDGSFDGAIEVAGTLLIGDGARVVAESIRATTAIIGGSVKGNILADKVEIQRTGRIYGDINVITFVTEEGAILRGSVTMRDESDLGDDTRPMAVGANGAARA